MRITRLERELFERESSELKDHYWRFKYSHDLSLERNLYEFSRWLERYKRTCLQWEAHHNGLDDETVCVRDKYLMPVIQEFTRSIFLDKSS